MVIVPASYNATSRAFEHPLLRHGRFSDFGPALVAQGLALPPGRFRHLGRKRDYRILPATWLVKSPTVEVFDVELARTH